MLSIGLSPMLGDKVSNGPASSIHGLSVDVKDGV
jgi:hypothetical protein